MTIETEIRKKDSQPSPSRRTMTINYGPQHPAMHGTLRVVMELEGETIVKATPHIGYLHSGFEKQGEHMTYNQYVVVTDRMNYMSPLANNIGWAMTCEKLWGIEVPERTQYIRVILAELSRIADHLIWLGTHALDLGAFTVFLWCFREREKCYDIFESVCGARYTTSYTRIGGLMYDVPDDFKDRVRTFIDQFPKTLGEVESLLTRNRIWIDRIKGIGIISADDALSYGLTGPCLRASGVNWDLRKDIPYMVYDRFDFDVPIGENGDVYDRYLVRMEEFRQSLKIIRQAIDTMPEGEVNVSPEHKVMLPEKTKVYTKMESLIYHFEMIMPGPGLHPPVGEVYCATETSNGELGFYIVSDGGKTPYRVRVRPPSFINYSAFPTMTEGHMLADAVAILGSLNIIAAELDR